MIMTYRKTKDLIQDLEKQGQLVRITDEVDPCLEMAEIQRRVYKAGGPAVLFEKVKDSPFSAVSNLYGTHDRIRYIFRNTINPLKIFMHIVGSPQEAFKHPFKTLRLLFFLPHGLPKKVMTFRAPVLKNKTTIDKLPGIISWKDDGGRYITLPQVYSQHPEGKGPMSSNLGMYRVQLNGNEYKPDEVGLHYQIHRGIAHHHQESLRRNEPLKVSIFIGGPPAMTVAAVMPLPDNVPEISFGGLLGKRRFRYTKVKGHVIAAEADFCITGTIEPGAIKPEGPFGDHLGYYSLTHDMPVMKVDAVYHRDDAVWPFTVVGRPPQEDTEFGDFIHEITRPAVSSEVSGLKEVHAVDQAGVHPLLLAIGSDHYVPYMKRSRPAQLLTVANGILGSGQLSLAKYLLISAEEDDHALSTHDIALFLCHILERINLKRDIHFTTNTTIDTLDYSGDGLNKGSKVILAASGEPVRKLGSNIAPGFSLPEGFSDAVSPLQGVLAVTGPKYKKRNSDVEKLKKNLVKQKGLKGFPLIVIVDDSLFVSENIDNFLWVTFTRSNPASDIDGLNSFYDNKHWGCEGSMIIDARIKPHHAPPLIEDKDVNKRVDLIMGHYPQLIMKKDNGCL